MLFIFWGQSSGESPFSRDDLQHCTYPFKGENKFFKSTSKTFQFNYLQNKTIHFKLCGQFGLGDVCPPHTVACVKDHITGKKISLGNKFSLEGDKYLSSKNGSRCNVTQSYSVSIYPKTANDLPPSLLRYEDCTYKISMYLPAPSTKCWVEIYGKRLDFTPISRPLRVISPERNFSLTLCDWDPSCGSTDFSACEIVDKTINPLSTTSSLIPFYNGDENQIVFKGHTTTGPNNKINKRLEVRLKCNWDKSEVRDEDLTYIKVPTQGKRYAFNLETSYGCVRENRPCVVKQGNLLYNLSKLYFDHPLPWQVKGKDSTYLIQVCGPLSVSDISCEGKLAQVCEKSKELNVNRGSILSNLEVVNDVVRATIDSGEKCNENQQHSTFIDFVCNNQEHGPQIKRLEDQTECDTFFEWQTPQACPNYDLKSCGNFEEVSYSCQFNEHGKIYDLNPLRGVRVVSDNRSSEISFAINVCGAVVDPDALCTKDVSVARKNSSEPNVKFRFTSLGKFLNGTDTEGSLVLHYTTGGYCDGSDYRSQIRFECNKEEKLTLERQDECYYEFLWKTPYGCPKISMDETDFVDVDCSFTDSKNNKRLEFGPIAPIRIEEQTRQTTLYFCSKIYSSCSVQETDCPKVTLGKELVNISDNMTSVQFNLNNVCNTETQGFNVVILNLKCQLMKTNQKYVTHLDGCTLTLDYFTPKVCSLPKIRVPPDSSLEVFTEKLNANDHDKVNVDQFLQTKNQNSLNVINCPIKSPYTETEVTIHKVSNSFLNQHCPTSTKFNETFEYVRLLYSTNGLCLAEPTRNISYEVFLLCSTGKDPPFNSQTDVCRSVLSYKDEEYCNFFKTKTLKEASNTLLIAGSILGSVFLFALLTLVVVYRKSKCGRALRRCDMIGLYERDVLS